MYTPWRDSVYAATPLVVLYNFWKYLFVKIVARVLGPDHIVTSLEHLGTVPGVQVTSLFVLGLRHVRILLTNRYFQNLNTYR
jgi:hypothetical protein